MKRCLIFLLALTLALTAMQAAMPAALAMTEQRAEALVKAADVRAQKAKQFWAYPDGEGAWVFYADGYNEALFKGAFWYVTEENQVPLGEYTQSVSDWGLLQTEPPVFYSVTIHGADGAHHPHAAILRDGQPLEIKNLGRLIDLDCCNGSLVGLTKQDADKDLEYVFLGVKEDGLVEIAAAPIDEGEAREITGMDEVLDALLTGDEINPGGVAVKGFLFRNAVPGQYRNEQGCAQGSVTLIVEDRGQPGWVYVFIDQDGIACVERGWEREIVIHTGTPEERYDVGLDIVETVLE